MELVLLLIALEKIVVNLIPILLSPNLRSGVILFYYCYYYYFLFWFFGSRGKKITPSSRERHKGIIGRGHDLRLVPLLHNPIDFIWGTCG